MSLKLDCPRKDFVDAVSMAGAAAGGRSPIQILQNLKIEAAEQSLRVLGCDGEMWVERTLPCMVTDIGSICVQAKLLTELATSLPDGDLHLQTQDGQGMLLTQGASEYRMLTLDAVDFPEPPSYGGEGELTLPMKTLRDAVDSVIFAVSGDAHRPILTGVLVSYDGSTLTLVATDTHRLAVRRISQEGLGSNITVVVPEKALRAIKSLPLADDDQITISFGGSRMGVEAAGAKIVSQVLAGTYPNWERVVPTESTRTWTVAVDQLLEKTKRAMIVARENANRIRFSGSGDSLTLSARGDERGDAKEEVPILAQNGDIEIAFNGKYVLDALGAVNGEGIRIEMTEHSRPAIFRPTDDDSYLCVIMPMALS
ncbi:MAG: DNA polymerase III subunit beta [Fimbriimonadales bacterium]